MLTMRPLRCAVINRAAWAEHTKAARTPASIIAVQRPIGWSQNGAGQVNAPSSTMPA